MKKNNAVQTAPKHSMLANQAPVPQKSKVSSQMTLSDSILSGAVVEFRKAGYRFMRHLHTNIEIYRILQRDGRSVCGRFYYDSPGCGTFLLSE